MAQSELVNSFKCYDIKTLFWGEQHTCLHLTGNRSRVGERCTGFCPFHVATVAKTGQHTKNDRRTGFWLFLCTTLHDAAINQVLSHLAIVQCIPRCPWRWCSTFPAVPDFPYCQSFGRFFCNVVNIHRHRPMARFICNDSCFRAI